MPRVHFDLRFLLWAGNQLQEAAQEFREELHFNPGFAPCNYYLGDIALTENRYLEALDLFQGAIVVNPKCLDAYLGLGKTYVRMNRFSEAVKPFELANRLDPEQPDVHYWLATVYRHLQQKEKSGAAMRRYEELIQKVKDLPPSQRPAHDRWVSATCINPPQ
jgi:tetratricopeptide (TPR) repeat protein